MDEALAAEHEGCGGPGALTQLLAKVTAAATEGCVCVSTRSEAAGADALLSPFSFPDSEGAPSAATYPGTWVGMVLVPLLSLLTRGCCQLLPVLEPEINPLHSRWAF